MFQVPLWHQFAKSIIYGYILNTDLAVKLVDGLFLVTDSGL